MTDTFTPKRSAILGSLGFKIPLLFIIMLLLMMASFLWVMKNYGQPLLLEVSKQQVRQSGSAIVSAMAERLALTSALVSTLANTAEVLPKDETLSMQVFRQQIDLAGSDHFIAGGGIWPEPLVFDPTVKRRSFFWGRDANNHLNYYNDYNDLAGNGYHQEEWYVPVRYLPKGGVYWSRSYMDPYSYQSMVTVSAPIYREGSYFGAATIDLKLEGLTELLAHEAKKFDGYAYALDRNGTFLSYPDETISKQTIKTEDANSLVEFRNISDVMEHNPHFSQIISTLHRAESISKLNPKLYSSAEDIAHSSPQIDLDEAFRIISIIANPFKNKPTDESLIREFEMPYDAILNAPVLVNVFHVPNTYWKIVNVTPLSKINENSESITHEVLLNFLYVIGFGLIIGFLLLNWFLLTPLRHIREQFHSQQGDQFNIKGHYAGEIGELVEQFNHRSELLVKSNIELEQSVVESTNANQAKAQFLANMSHEIRTPMNGVMGMLNLLQRGDLSQQQQHFVSVALSSASNLLILINDILDFSKIEAGKLELENIEFNLNDFLCEFSNATAHLAHNKSLELIFDIHELDHDWVIGDPNRIRQVLTNLVSNAIKFTDEGTITIKVGLRDAQGMGLILFSSVQDTGIGIAKGKQHILFDSFSQVDTSTTRQYGGSGLGLAICKQLCELMGGSISVRSEMALGSCFEFAVVLEKSKRQDSPHERLDLNQKHILVVDDNRNNLNLLNTLLETFNVRVKLAESARQAINFLENPNQYQFDGAIIDLEMPLMNGEQFVEKAQEFEHFNDIPLIAMTSISHLSTPDHYAQLGFSAVLTKPILPANLQNALRLAIQKKAPVYSTEPTTRQYFLETISHANLSMANALEQPVNIIPARILLVEDNLINQEVALGILEGIGYRADVVANGQEAIDALMNAGNETPYDLILMDCQMPIMDGYEATRRIRHGDESIHDHKIPIIAMTANAMHGDREKCLNVGMNDYLAKPIDIKILQEKLEKWLIL